MRILRAILFLMMLALTAKASTVNINLTNIFGATATNSIKLTPVAPSPQSDGTYLTIGTFKWFNTTNGLYSITTLSPGNYKMEIQGVTLNPTVFALPSGSATYDITNIWLSGYNVYNYTPGVFQLLPLDSSIIISPTNGRGSLTISAGGANTNYVSNNYTLKTVFNAFSNSIGSAGYSNANVFQPASTNLTNWAKLQTNIFGGFNTNFGTSAYSNANQFQQTNIVLTAYATIPTNTFSTASDLASLSNSLGTISRSNAAAYVGTNDFITFTNSIGTAGLLSSNAYQPASTFLTNWASVPTNQMVNTNVFKPFTNTLGTAAFLPLTTWQGTNGNLTGYAAIGTNTFATFTALAGLSNVLGTASRSNASDFQNPSTIISNIASSGVVITNVLAGANVTVTINSNTATVSSTGGGSVSGNYVSNYTGVATNLTVKENANGDSIIVARGEVPITFANASASVVWDWYNNGASSGGIWPNMSLFLSPRVGTLVMGFGTNGASIQFPVGIYTKNISLGDPQSGSTLTITNWGQLTNGLLLSILTNQFMPTSTNGTNWSLHATNDYWGKIDSLQHGTLVLTNFDTLGTNYAWPRVTALQPASLTLTNWQAHNTNDYYGTNLNLQAGSVQLTNFSTITTAGFIRTNIAGTSAKGTVAVWNGTNWVIIAPGTDGYLLTASNATPTGLVYTPPSSPLSGIGTPQSAVAGFPGNTYLDTSATNFYVKVTGAGTTTGWSLLTQGTKP